MYVCMYLLFTGVMMPIAGRLVRRSGRQRLDLDEPYMPGFAGDKSEIGESDLRVVR